MSVFVELPWGRGSAVHDNDNDHNDGMVTQISRSTSLAAGAAYKETRAEDATGGRAKFEGVT